ncbi:MAG: hypothetical protein IPO48_21100 [Saprospiraceae bacterium]|nr:hypothetical protein [Saprospiraceae bacterium]
MVKKLINGKYGMYAGNGQQVISSSADTDINSNDSDLWRTQNGSNSSYYLEIFQMNNRTLQCTGQKSLVVK